MSDQHIGVDHASEPEIKVEERFMKPTAEYPMVIASGSSDSAHVLGC